MQKLLFSIFISQPIPHLLTNSLTRSLTLWTIMRISRHRDPSEHLSATLFHENIDLLRRGWCRGGRRPRCRCSSRAAPSPAAQCTPPLAGSSLTTTRVSDPYLVRSGVFAWLRIRFLNPLSGSGSKAHNYAESTLIVFYLFIRIEKNNNN